MNLTQRLVKCYHFDNPACNQAFINYIDQQQPTDSYGATNLTTKRIFRISDIDHNQQPYSEFFTWFNQQLSNYVLGLVDGEPASFNYNFIALWAAQYGPEDQARSHVHGISSISWVYYLHADSLAADLEFDTVDLRIKPLTGQLVMFPGWLRHSVAAGGPRTILAGNVMINC